VTDTPDTPAAPEKGSLRVVGHAPHIVASMSGRKIMFYVIAALAPTALWAIWNMGLPAIIVFASCLIGAVGTEWLWNAIAKRPQTVSDGSAIITGMLLAMCGVLGRQFFGGALLGVNVVDQAHQIERFALRVGHHAH